MSDDAPRSSLSSVIKITNRDRDNRETYFRLHKCSLADVRSRYRIKCGRIRRFILDLTAVNMEDIRARSMFKSYASLSAERYRQFQKYPYTIHPFSKLRFWSEVLVVVSLVISKSLMPFWIATKEPLIDDLLHEIISLFDCIYISINIPINILTGYVDGKNRQHIVLDNCKILKKYFFTWMLIDIIALLCFIFDVFSEHEDSIFYLILDPLGVLQLFIIFHYEQNICKVLRMGVPLKTALELVLFLTNYLSSNIVLQFAIEYGMEGTYNPQQPRNSSWITICDLWDASWQVRLMYGLTRAVGMLRKNSHYNLLKEDGCFEIFFVVAWFIAQILILHCSFKYMLALFGSQSAKTKYYIMSQQIQAYMNQKRFPPRIKKKILKFYAIRFQSHFFLESTMMNCVSGQLREDIIMHTGRQLVREVTFLKQLPRAVLIQISLMFKLVIFIEGDVIYKVNTIGDQMYFIHKGTVAFYSESGCELNHREDGDYFGEVALVTRHRNRFTTAVAVSNCELFSLSRQNFEMIECYPTVYDELKKAAIRKIQLIKVLDQQYKDQLKD